MELDPSFSVDSVKGHFLDEQGLFKKHKVNEILISNESAYNLIIILQLDPTQSKLLDGNKVLDRHKIPTVKIVHAGATVKFEVHTKVNYLSVLFKNPDGPGYFSVRSKHHIKRSAKWTATTKMVDSSRTEFAEQEFVELANALFQAILQTKKSVSAASTVNPLPRGSFLGFSTSKESVTAPLLTAEPQHENATSTATICSTSITLGTSDNTRESHSAPEILKMVRFSEQNQIVPEVERDDTEGTEFDTDISNSLDSPVRSPILLTANGRSPSEEAVAKLYQAAQVHPQAMGQQEEKHELVRNKSCSELFERNHAERSAETTSEQVTRSAGCWCC